MALINSGQCSGMTRQPVPLISTGFDPGSVVLRIAWLANTIPSLHHQVVQGFLRTHRGISASRPRNRTARTAVRPAPHRKRCGSWFLMLEPRCGSYIIRPEPRRCSSNRRFHKQYKHRKCCDMHILCRFCLYFWVFCLHIQNEIR